MFRREVLPPLEIQRKPPRDRGSMKKGDCDTMKKFLALILTLAMALSVTACGGSAVNDKNIADALNDIVKSSVAAGLTKDYTFKPRTDEQAMAKAIAALSEAEWNTKGDGGNKFSGPVMKILGLNEGGKNETSRFVWCGAVIADEIGTTGQAHNVMNNILSQKAANADKLTGKEPGNIRYIGTALGTLTIHGKQTTVRFIVVTAEAVDE